jgi:hypothetical protein
VSIDLLLAVALLTAEPSVTPSPSPDDLTFRAAIARMNALPAPPSFTYDADVRTSGGAFVMQPQSQGTIGLVMMAHPGSMQVDEERVSLAFDGSARMVTLLRNGSAAGRIHSPLFDPVWSAAFGWMSRHGLWPLPATAVASTPDPTADAPSTIAAVAATPAFAYRVARSEAAACPNGDRGRWLYVVPVRDPDTHPLAAVLLDDSTSSLCVVRFEEAFGSTSDVRVRGTSELHFDEVGPYTLATSLSIDVRGIVTDSMQPIHVTEDIAFRDFSFETPIPAITMSP